MLPVSSENQTYFHTILIRSEAKLGSNPMDGISLEWNFPRHFLTIFSTNFTGTAEVSKDLLSAVFVKPDTRET